jgi:hypothetical protein
MPSGSPHKYGLISARHLAATRSSWVNSGPDGPVAESRWVWAARKQTQRFEIGDAIETEHHGLAIDYEPFHAVLLRRLDDPGKAVSPVVAASG